MKKNPLTFTLANVRRWIYINLQKYFDEKGKIKPTRKIQAILDCLKYFDQKIADNFSTLEIVMNKYVDILEHLLTLQDPKYWIKEVWRFNVIEQPRDYDILWKLTPRLERDRTSIGIKWATEIIEQQELNKPVRIRK